VYRKTLYRCFALVWLVTLAGCATDHWCATRVTDGLVLYYSFAADDDSVAHDQSGNGHDGKIINAKRVTDRIAGSALSFDGQSAYVRVTNAKQLQSTNFSFSVWAQTREKIGVGPNRGILGKRKADRYGSYYLSQQQGRIAAGMCGPRPNDGRSIETSAEPLLNTWGNLAFTYNGDTARFYLNGKLVGERKGVIYNTNDYDLIIGATEFRSYNDKPQGFWNGLITEVRIYDRALSAKEVQTLYEVIASKIGVASSSSRATSH